MIIIIPLANSNLKEKSKQMIKKDANLTLLMNNFKFK